MATNKKFILYFIVLGIFWGGSFLAIRYAVQGLGSCFAVFLRVLVALILLRVFFIRKGALLPKKYLWQVLGCGLFSMAFPWALLFWAEKTIAPALASVLNSSTTMFVVMLAPVFNPKDKVTANQWGGVLMGMLGIVIIFWPELIKTEFNIQLLSMLAMLCTALFYGISNQWTRRISQHVDVRTNAFYQLLSATVFMLFISVIFDRQFILPEFHYSALLGVLYLGIFSTGLAQLMSIWIIKNVGSVQSAGIVYFIPVVSVLLDLIVLKQGLKINQYLGGFVILAALLLLNKRVKKRFA